MSFFSDLLNPDILFTRMATESHIRENEYMTERTINEIRANRNSNENQTRKVHGTVFREGNTLILSTDEGYQLWDDKNKRGTGIPCDSNGNVIVENTVVVPAENDFREVIPENTENHKTVDVPPQQEQINKLLGSSDEDLMKLAQHLEKMGFGFFALTNPQYQKGKAEGVSTPKAVTQEDLDKALLGGKPNKDNGSKK